MVGEARAEGEEAPAEASAWEPDVRRDFLEDEVVRDLAEKVATVEDSVDLVKLGSCSCLLVRATGKTWKCERGSCTFKAHVLLRA